MLAVNFKGFTCSFPVLPCVKEEAGFFLKKSSRPSRLGSATNKSWQAGDKSLPGMLVEVLAAFGHLK